MAPAPADRPTAAELADGLARLAEPGRILFFPRPARGRLAAG
jgi:hypothetical protein